jgi:hypothetical protein
MPIHNKHHNHWHHDVYNDPDDRVIKHIKTEALDFNGCLDPLIFTRWIHNIDHLSKN